MAGREGVTAEPMDGAAAVRAGSAFRLVHAEALAGTPYCETDEAASAAHRPWGYRKVGEGRPGGEGAELHDVMLLDLR